LELDLKFRKILALEVCGYMGTPSKAAYELTVIGVL
jgi:hypothetical protein